MLSLILAADGFNVVGMDISLASLHRLKQKTKLLDVFQGDADVLPIQSKSLDAVVCLGSWRYFRNIERVVKEISRLLKLKGVFIVGYFPPAIAGIIHV
ncbi:MAG: hypothetical protein BA862_04160 [Desulfobulbaceae bacterium S3730MH12]|nr:MAG: hypothetical protein BA866_02135 [Desulfobulbaceae bacterium S5133MH15]OEU54862.1 MAG: hypothetical protein BA862_04160 [Desulfobulbaceae bacterium S3730MH12]OEU80969.1 MAG: hypothetical protein BA873_02600 [Desulfobulbaceae bacterium C00003063]